MRYRVFGPFDLPRTTARHIDKSAEARKAFFGQVNEGAEGLADAVGCYVFCIGKKPWYVGLAERQPFRKECLAAHKLLAYNSALTKMQGKPRLFLVALTTPKGRFCKPTANRHAATRFLENLLIGQAVAKNEDLENIKGTKFLHELVVPGVINTPPGVGKQAAVRSLRAVLG